MRLQSKIRGGGQKRRKTGDAERLFVYSKLSARC